jgi:Tfp pilus assembly protein PilX
MIRQNLNVSHRGEEGIALVTTLVILLIMTVLGMGAVAVTALENRIAGFQRTGESATSAAESCLGTSVNIIQQTIAIASVPVAFVSTSATSADGLPVRKDAETGANPTLTQEILGQADSHSDVVTGSGTSNGPDYLQQVNGYTVLGDIDRLYVQAKAGSGLQFASGYEGVGMGSASGGVDVIYRVDCRAQLVATGTESHIVGIYACTLTGETCQRKL